MPHRTEGVPNILSQCVGEVPGLGDVAGSGLAHVHRNRNGIYSGGGRCRLQAFALWAMKGYTHALQGVCHDAPPRSL